MTATKLTITLGHKSSIPGARWVTPVGWEPANDIDGSEYLGGSWWGSTEETAGLVYFGAGAEGDTEEVDAEDLRIAATGDCRVIGRVEV